jgi:hypothetical protein
MRQYQAARTSYPVAGPSGVIELYYFRQSTKRKSENVSGVFRRIPVSEVSKAGRLIGVTMA